MTRIENTMIMFGRNVQLRRQSIGISQEELAFRAGLHRTYIGMVERAERSISLQNAKKIADALNVKLDNLLNDGEKT
ncbi:helix-turn-helix domain-containing protein [uncultured Muribaculum sp.]